MMNRRIIPVVLSVSMLILSTAFSQHVTQSQSNQHDSLHHFTIERLYDMVISHHPVAKQSILLSEVAKQELRLARGNFDPKLESQWMKKELGATEYYNIFNASLKFPSVIPVNPGIGVEQNSGKYLNPERYISNEYDNRQFYAGVSIPLLRGLITDERRAALRQAELFGDLMEAEQVKILNKLLLDAAKDYWQWAYAYYAYDVYNRSVSIATEIFDRVKLNYTYGEAAMIDTIQAHIILQQRLIERREALLEFQNAGIRLSNYLWDNLGNPLQLYAYYKPVMQSSVVGITKAELDELLSLAQVGHPELKKLDVKLKQLSIDQRLAREFLKPKLDLNYYFLNQPFDPNWRVSTSFNDAYKFGVDFSLPIFLRKERAKLMMTKVKINATALERTFSERQIVNEIQATYNQLTNSSAIIAQQSIMVQSYGRLLEAELLNLNTGESDLFKINVQQDKMLQAEAKLIKLLSEFEKQKAFLYWAAGVSRLNNK